MNLSQVLIVAIVFASFYKIIETFAHRKERINFIEKLGTMDLSKLNNVDLNKMFGDVNSRKYWPLRIGSLFVGLGLGLLIGYLIVCSMDFSVMPDLRDNQIANIYGASTLIFGGLGLLLSFLAEKKFRKEDDIQ